MPSALAFLALGDVIAAALLQTGRFTHARRAVRLGHPGRLDGGAARLHARPPLRLDLLRAARHAHAAALRGGARGADHGARLGYARFRCLPALVGIDPRWGVAGLTASAGLAGWVEFVLLRRTLNRRIGSTGLPPWLAAKLWIAAGAAAAAGWAVKLALGRANPVVAAALILAPYGVVYFAVAAAVRVDEARATLRRLRLPL